MKEIQGLGEYRFQASVTHLAAYESGQLLFLRILVFPDFLWDILEIR